MTADPRRPAGPVTRGSATVSTFHEDLYADLLLFFAGRVRVAHIRQWERCITAFVEAAALDPGLGRIVTTLPARFLGQIETLLLRGRDRGDVRRNVSLDLAASALMGAFVFRRLLLRETPTSAQVTAVPDMLLPGISETGPTPATANP